jgi:predicted peptidase
MIYKIEVGGTEGWNLELYIPDATPKDAKLPLVLFNTGNGEVGKNESDRAEIYRQGPMYYIQNGWKPNFMVGGCQSTFGWAGYPFNLAMLQELTGGGYPLDKDGIILTGLSGGAHACHEYVQDTPPDKYIPVRGIIPMSIAPETPKYPDRHSNFRIRW